jgi:hypothetical protein
MRVDFNVAPITEGVIALRRDALADWAADESAGDAAKDVRHDIANVARDKELTQCSEQAANAATQIEFDVTRDESWAFFIPEAALSQLGCYYVGEEWSLRYKPPSDLLNTLRELEIPRVYGDDAPWGVVYDAAAARGSAFGVEAEPREVSLCGGFYLQFPAGLFNFIESMRELDAYAYAVFPKNDVLGVVVDTQVGAQGMASGGRVDVVRRQSRSSTEPVLTSYGTGRRLEDSDAPRAVRFGWIISAGDRLLPSLKTQLALVSVPAWTDKLEVTVTTGWLDRWGRQHNAQTMAPMEIKLPPDFSAFDSIFRSHGWVTPAPQIQDEAIDDDIYVIVGEDARILIPGFRLWRSTSVTLGAQPADRIRVLPNMEGIIAEFLPVRLPSAKYKARSEVSAEQQDWSSSAQSDASSAPPAGETETTQDRAGQDTAPSGQEVAEACDLGDVPDQTLRNVLQKTMQARSVRLRVWTSEGVALATKRVCVMYDPKRQLVQRLAEREDLRHERERRAVLGSDAAAKEAKEKEGEER